MAYEFQIGEQVTIAPPYDDLPVILSMRRHARVTGRELVGDQGVYVPVEIDAVSADNRDHLVPVEHVLHGWLDLRTL